MKIVIDDVVGVKCVADGNGVEVNTTLTNVKTNALTAATTLTAGGVYLASSSSGALTMTMPLASSCPGSTFVFRSTSAHAHALTGSAESNGTKVFCGFPGGTVENNGSKVALSATQGSSVVLVSDGLSFLVSAMSGTCTISGT